jgi:hypothetical protein
MLCAAGAPLVILAPVAAFVGPPSLKQQAVNYTAYRNADGIANDFLSARSIFENWTPAASPTFKRGLRWQLTHVRDDLYRWRNSFIPNAHHGAILVKAEISVEQGFQDLRAAIARWDGNFDPTKRVQFLVEFSKGEKAWNDGIRTIWHISEVPRPPLLNG